MSKEESEHARELIKYQNMRGGRVVFQDIPKPVTEDWQSALAAVQAALDLEKKVNAVSSNLKSILLYMCIFSLFIFHVYYVIDLMISNILSFKLCFL
jgi:ferritin